MTDVNGTRFNFRLSRGDASNLVLRPMEQAGISASAQIVRALRFARESMPDDYALNEEMYVKSGVRQFKRETRPALNEETQP